MNEELRQKLLQIAKEQISSVDVSHDFEHARRVLFNAEKIARKENGDLDIIVPAALFHDVILYPKNSPNTHKSQEESAEAAEKILNKIETFPKEKIEKIKTCILECSFSKGIMPDLWESKILQDSDLLEAVGAIAIMRTYSSTGQVKRPFYCPEDPFCQNRTPDTARFALDLFYARLLKVLDRIHTKTAQAIAERRTKFLLDFLEELKLELVE